MKEIDYEICYIFVKIAKQLIHERVMYAYITTFSINYIIFPVLNQK